MFTVHYYNKKVYAIFLSASQCSAAETKLIWRVIFFSMSLLKNCKSPEFETLYAKSM